MNSLRKRITIAGALLSLFWITVPGVTLACERCFGAGADSQTVRAISASMFLLVVLMGFMGGGIFSFFNSTHERALLLEKEKSRARDGQTATDENPGLDAHPAQNEHSSGDVSE